jgi:hypothetical protein
MVTAALLRVGFLSGEGSSEEEAVVETVSTILPDERDIGVCVSYSDFSSTQAHPFQERTCSFLRARPASLTGWRDPPISAAIPKMQIALRTAQLGVVAAPPPRSATAASAGSRGTIAALGTRWNGS